MNINQTQREAGSKSPRGQSLASPTITQFPVLVYTWQESRSFNFPEYLNYAFNTSLSASSSLKVKQGKSLTFSAAKKGTNGTQRSSPASESSGHSYSRYPLWIFSPFRLTHLIMIPDPSLLSLADLLTPPFLVVLQQIVTWLSTPLRQAP